MKAQCPCVTGPERIPNPQCPKCAGSGFIEVSFPEEDDIEALWIGRCYLCGSENGGAFQRKGKPPPVPDEYWRCMNKDCSRPQITLVRDDTILACWLAVCPLCSTGHWVNYLQLHDSPEPTVESHPRQCPNEDCKYSPMSWVRADQLE